MVQRHRSEAKQQERSASPAPAAAPAGPVAEFADGTQLPPVPLGQGFTREDIHRVGESLRAAASTRQQRWRQQQAQLDQAPAHAQQPSTAANLLSAPQPAAAPPSAPEPAAVGAAAMGAQEPSLPPGLNAPPPQQHPQPAPAVLFSHFDATAAAAQQQQAVPQAVQPVGYAVSSLPQGTVLLAQGAGGTAGQSTMAAFQPAVAEQLRQLAGGLAGPLRNCSISLMGPGVPGLAPHYSAATSASLGSQPSVGPPAPALLPTLPALFEDQFWEGRVHWVPGAGTPLEPAEPDTHLRLVAYHDRPAPGVEGPPPRLPQVRAAHCACRAC